MHTVKFKKFKDFSEKEPMLTSDNWARGLGLWNDWVQPRLRLIRWDCDDPPPLPPPPTATPSPSALIPCPRLTQRESNTVYKDIPFAVRESWKWESSSSSSSSISTFKGQLPFLPLENDSSARSLLQESLLFFFPDLKRILHLVCFNTWINYSKKQLCFSLRLWGCLACPPEVNLYQQSQIQPGSALDISPRKRFLSEWLPLPFFTFFFQLLPLLKRSEESSLW